LPPSHVAIRLCLKLAGVYGRGQRNAARIIVDRFRACWSNSPNGGTVFGFVKTSNDLMNESWQTWG
jgi:hypothetical protein